MPAAVGPMTAVRVPAAAASETSFSTRLPPSVTSTWRSAMSPRSGAVIVPVRPRSGAFRMPSIRAYDALACAITLLMKPIMMTGKIRMTR